MIAHINIFIFLRRAMKKFLKEVWANFGSSWHVRLEKSWNEICISEADSKEPPSAFNGASRPLEYWNLHHTVPWDRRWSFIFTESSQISCLAILIMHWIHGDTWKHQHFFRESEYRWLNYAHVPLFWKLDLRTSQRVVVSTAVSMSLHKSDDVIDSRSRSFTTLSKNCSNTTP